MTPIDRRRARQLGDETEIVAELDRRRAEAFTLEVMSLAKRYGLEVRLERVTDTKPDSLP